jgi:hypothetical protein
LWIRTISKAVEKQIKDARADILLLQQNQEKSLGSVMTDLVMTRDLLNKDSMQSERREVFQWLYDANHGAKVRVAQDCIQPGASNGKWLLQSMTFERWKKNFAAQVLFLSGPCALRLLAFAAIMLT